MQRQDPYVLIRDLVTRRYQPVEGSIRVDRARFVDKNAAFAVAFDDQTGTPHRALLGLFQDDDGLWYSTGAPPVLQRWLETPTCGPCGEGGAHRTRTEGQRWSVGGLPMQMR